MQLIGRCLTFLMFLSTPAIAQWSMTGSLGYSRAIQSYDLNGGPAYSIGFSRTGPGVRAGFELGAIDLGHSRASFRIQGGLFPGAEPSIVITDDSQHGWRLAGFLDLLTVGRISWVGSVGFYRLTGKHGSEARDTTGQIVRPRQEMGGTSNGAGLMTGLRVHLLQVSTDLGLSIEATAHAIGLRSTGEEAGYSFFHYFTVGARIRLRL